MTGAGESIKTAPPIPAYLFEQMSVARMVEALEGLHFNKKYGEGRLVIDEGVQAFLIARPKLPPLIISTTKFVTCGAGSSRRAERSADGGNLAGEHNNHPTRHPEAAFVLRRSSHLRRRRHCR